MRILADTMGIQGVCARPCQASCRNLKEIYMLWQASSLSMTREQRCYWGFRLFSAAAAVGCKLILCYMQQSVHTSRHCSRLLSPSCQEEF